MYSSINNLICDGWQYPEVKFGYITITLEAWRYFLKITRS